MDDLDLKLTSSEGESSSSECEEEDVGTPVSDAETVPSEDEGKVTGILPRNSDVASGSNARTEAGAEEGKVTGILPRISNDASGSNARAEAEKNNNQSRVKTTDGVDLFPPDGTKMRKASQAWSYGGLKKDDKGRLLRDKMYCALCTKTFKYNQSPSALSDHLKHKHADKMLELESAKQSQSKLTDFRFIKTDVQEKYKATHPKQKQFRSDLVDWVIKDKRPFAISDDKGLRKVVKNLDPRIKVPAGRTISRDIATKYLQRKRITLEKLKKVNYFSCTNDGGTSLANSSFIAINVHWVDENFSSQKKLIDMKPVEGKTATEYRAAVDESLEKHNIKGKTVSFTTDNEPTMNATFSRSERNGCFAHIESKACQKAMDDVDVLKKLRKKLRKIASKSNKSPKFKRSIKKEQIQREIPVITLKQEVATRFTSTKIMFDSFIPSKPGEEEIDIEKAQANIEAINAAMKSCLPKKDYKRFEIEKKDTDVIIKTLPTLRILEEGITRIGGEKYSTGSLVLPFLSKFLEFLEGEEEDVVYVRKFKKKLQSELITRCRNNLNFEQLALSSFCDMRYSNLKFLEVLERFLVCSLSKEDVVASFQAEMETIHDEDVEDIEISLEPKKKKSRKSFLDDDEEDEMTQGSGPSVQSQLDNYLKEIRIKSKECPGAWWRMNKDKYPDIAKLARRYLSIQGTSTPAERVMSDMGLILNKKRLAMSDDNFRMLMYLGDSV